MSPFVRNVLLATSLAAVLLGLAEVLASLPGHMHRAGLVAPMGWEQAVVDLLQPK